jgi:vacuolar protein sorting-associated protein VTA1
MSFNLAWKILSHTVNTDYASILRADFGIHWFSTFVLFGTVNRIWREAIPSAVRTRAVKHHLDLSTWLFPSFSLVVMICNNFTWFLWTKQFYLFFDISYCAQDFSRRGSFSAVQPGNNLPPQSTEFNDHPSTQSPYSSPPPSQSQHPSPSQSYSSPSYQATDYPSSDIHKPSPNYSSSPYTSTDYPTNELHKPPSNYSPPPYTRTDHPSNDGYNPHSNDKPDVSAYPQAYQPPPYTIDPQHISQNYYSTKAPAAPYNYPNFQSYPSFQDSTSPSVPTEPTYQSSFYPATDGPAATSYTPASNSSAPTHYHSTADYSPQVTPPAAPPASQYKYDSSYQPEVEKIAEAHKAARFAVGALAFDDVSVAVDHLKRALDLLTNPSAEPR